MAAQFAGATASPGKSKRPPGTGLTKAEKKARKAAADKAAAAAKQKEAGSPAGYKGKFPDTEGALGPNGLARMAGGNPAGGPCTRFAKDGKCSFKFCSYSHEKD